MVDVIFHWSPWKFPGNPYVLAGLWLPQENLDRFIMKNFARFPWQQTQDVSILYHHTIHGENEKIMEIP